MSGANSSDPGIGRVASVRGQGPLLQRRLRREERSEVERSETSGRPAAGARRSAAAALARWAPLLAARPEGSAVLARLAARLVPGPPWPPGLKARLGSARLGLQACQHLKETIAGGVGGGSPPK